MFTTSCCVACWLKLSIGLDLSANGACSNTPEPNSDKSTPDTDSNATISDLIEEDDERSTTMENNAPNKVSSLPTDSDSEIISQEGERGRSNSIRKTPQTPQTCTSSNLTPGHSGNMARSTRGQKAAKKPYEKELPEQAAQWMRKAGGDHMKAAGFWFERQEKKGKEPWSQLEKGKAYLEEMKKVPLDPRALQREIEEEEAEKEEAARRRMRKRRCFRKDPVDSEAALLEPSVSSKQQTPAIEQTDHVPETQKPAPSTASQEDQLLPVSTQTSEVPKPLSAALAKKRGASVALGDIESQTPEKRKRTEAKNLESSCK
ncbi:hypothetical protein F5Y10DRAFT_179823 [Nemania abortiva]|nr:hypothetical protein F5Y10DRAFT_179823 [Nemania abortiva]